MKLGKLPTLPWYLRLVAFLIVGGLMYAGFWYFVTSGTRAETKTMEDEIAQLRPRNAQLQIVSQNLNNFKATYKAREEEFAELEVIPGGALAAQPQRLRLGDRLFHQANCLVGLALEPGEVGQAT